MPAGCKDRKISAGYASARRPGNSPGRQTCYNSPFECPKVRALVSKIESSFMPDFICRLGTPSGEVVTKIVEAVGAAEAKLRLEADGSRVFAVSSAENG